MEETSQNKLHFYYMYIKESSSRRRLLLFIPSTEDSKLCTKALPLRDWNHWPQQQEGILATRLGFNELSSPAITVSTVEWKMQVMQTPQRGQLARLFPPTSQKFSSDMQPRPSPVLAKSSQPRVPLQRSPQCQLPHPDINMPTHWKSWFWRVLGIPQHSMTLLMIRRDWSSP